MIMRVQKLVYEAVADLRRRAEGAMHSGQNMPFSYWSVMFSIPVLQLIVLETGNVLMGHPNWKRIQ